MIAEDYDITFSVLNLAESVKYNPARGSSFFINVIFDDKSVSSLNNLTLQPQVTTALKFFTDNQSDLKPKRDDTVEIRQKLYRVLVPEPDGFGAVMLPLEYQSAIP